MSGGTDLYLRGIASLAAGLSVAAGCGVRPSAAGGGVDRRVAEVAVATPTTAPATRLTARGGTPPATEPAVPARPGMATGMILRDDGKPVRGESVRLEVTVRGLSLDTNEDFTLTPRVNPDGAYEAELPVGTVRSVTALARFTFDNRPFSLALHPVQDNRRGREAVKGIRQDFVWKLNGLRPGYVRDETKAAPWYGASIDMIYKSHRDDLEKEVPPPPDKTSVVFTLTPTTPLADGREGKPVTFVRAYRSRGGLDNPMLPDLPLAWYKLEAHEVFADGGRGALLLYDPRDKKWKESVDGSFGSDLENHHLTSVLVRFTRPMDARSKLGGP